MKCNNACNCRDMIAVLKQYPATTPVKFAITTDRDILRTSAGGGPTLNLAYHRAVAAMEKDGCPVIVAVHFTGE